MPFVSAMPNLLSTRQKSPGAPPDPGALAEAFEVFSSAANSLQQSYGLLQSEVGRLRRELELRNRDLAQSMAENKRMHLRLSRILEDLPCGVVVLNAPLELRYANDVARRLLASAAASSHSDGPIPVALQAAFRELMTAKPGSERLWVLGEGADATFISISCAFTSGGTDSAQELVFILRDVTEQKRLQEEREFSKRMQALAEITALLAHEIRNPLGSLELFAGLVKDATRNDFEVSQWMVHLQAGLRALSATVNNVLNFYTEAPPANMTLDLVKLLSDTIEFLQPLALQRGMAIRWTKPEGQALVRGDQHRLQQVFFNIAINAFRAMTSGGVLTIHVNPRERAGRRWLRVAFEDQGSGIAAGNLSKIFDAGFTTRQASPGLGLAVCRRVIDQHRGTLEVESVEARGTTFILTLPTLGAEV
jgi:two-component system, sensor histidine kinase FlrB